MVPKELIEEIKDWMRNKRFGNIQINFANGKIPSWNLFTSIRPSSTSTKADTTQNSKGEKDAGTK